MSRSIPVKGEGYKTVEKQVGKDFYHIPTRNEKTGKIEVNTLLKKGEYFPVINEIRPRQILSNTRNLNFKMHLLTHKSKLI